jgi:hypothetical protein
MSPSLRLLATALLALGITVPVAAQTTGQIVGRVTSARDTTAVADTRVIAVAADGDSVAMATTGADGQFVLIGLAPGTYRLAAQRVGFRPTEVLGVVVRSGASTRLAVSLAPAVVELTPIPVTVVERPLLNPDVTASRQVVSRDELQHAPIQDIAQILELRTGVSDGHFRGGRVGQESYVIDGVEVKDQFAASRNGIAFQLAPSAVQEMNVFTSGFSADQPSAVSGVVTLVSRSGPTDRWFGRLEGVTDEMMPSALARGYVRLGGTAGGPLGRGATAFADLSLIGRADQDPRVHGLTCLPVAFPCPAQQTVIPHHQGDQYFAFGRLDVPLGARFAAMASLSRNRDQHELYATRFKYALGDYLAERETSTLGTMQLNGILRESGARAFRVSARVSLGRLDRYLGVPDTAQPARLGRFLLGDLRFRGEAAVREAAAGQISTGTILPGYAEPSDSGAGSPYGLWGADLFVTDGTSGIAEWTRSEFADARVELQTLVSPQHDLKVGGDVRLYHIMSYQHVHGGLAGAAPNFVEFYPRTAAAWVHSTLYTLDAATVDLGIRIEGYQPRLVASPDRRDLTAPTATTKWNVIVHPRVGFAMPLQVVGLDRVAVHWNFGRFSQPPDFQFFFDQSLDDSLNTAVRRQGNPNLAFERATEYEAGLDYLIGNDFVLRATGYLKDLSGITTSGIAIGAQGQTFTNLDFGRVQGLEVRFEGRLDPRRRFELGYVLQQAVGVASSAFDSVRAGGDSTARYELPLQFDRRHSIDLNVYWQLPAGFGIALGGTAGSGYPVPGAAERRLPWSVALAGRLVREWQWGARSVRVMLEGRNLLNRDNLETAREGGGVMPDVAALEARAAQETARATPIPRESPWYAPRFDGNQDGVLDAAEQTAARRAALFDYYEPTMLYGEARQIRIGFEIVF